MKSKGNGKKKVTVLGGDEIKVDGGVLTQMNYRQRRDRRDEPSHHSTPNLGGEYE